MRYYYVWVRSDRYRGHEPLTYASADVLPIGSIVRVPLRRERVLGFVSNSARKPPFKVKPIDGALSLPPLPASCIALAQWLAAFYAAPVGVVTTQFLPAALPDAIALPGGAATTAAEKFVMPAITWTAEQQQALDTIHRPDTYLLHGRTGSGKTNIYIELAIRTLTQGRSALILSPEIGLTSQLADEFRKSFPNQVLVLHSQLTLKQRQQIWLQIIHMEQPLVIIGPRSALFSPIRNLGLIIVDEAHDNAYKQEQAPYYHAVRVAARLRELTNATLVIGSATPSVNDYYLAAQRRKPVIRLSSLARSNSTLTHHVTIIDLKDRNHFTRSTHLSDELIAAMTASLERGEQSLLYLNRRGTARVTLCDRCGWQALCPHCDLPLAYHGDDFTLRCHTCGYSQSPVLSCPSCGNPSVVLKSFGTKAIVDEAQRLFPGTHIQRFDTDSAKSERLEQQYDRIIRGDIDILIGTQLIAKGLDLPRLSTLGIVLADTTLYLPDYTARERTYQLLTQVMGRVGRGHANSRTIVQTYYPDSPLIRAAMDDQWSEFYDGELAERRHYAFPPFRYLLKLSCRRASPSAAERAGEQLKDRLEASGLAVTVEGPAPAFHEKIAGKYQWQLVVKAGNRNDLLALIKLMPPNWSYDLDPSDLL